MSDIEQAGVPRFEPPIPYLALTERLGKRGFGKLIGFGRFRMVARDADLPTHLQHPEGDVRRVYDADDLRARAALRALPVGIPLRDGVTHLWRWSKPSGSHFRINW